MLVHAALFALLTATGSLDGYDDEPGFVVCQAYDQALAGSGKPPRYFTPPVAVPKFVGQQVWPQYAKYLQRQYGVRNPGGDCNRLRTRSEANAELAVLRDRLSAYRQIDTNFSYSE